MPVFAGMGEKDTLEDAIKSEKFDAKLHNYRLARQGGKIPDILFWLPDISQAIRIVCEIEPMSTSGME